MKKMNLTGGIARLVFCLFLVSSLAMTFMLTMQYSANAQSTPGWISQTGGRGWMTGVSAVSSDVAWSIAHADGNTYIDLTTDGGNTWSPKDSGMIGSLSGVSATSQDCAWIAGASWVDPDFQGTVQRTTDGGANWQSFLFVSIY